MGCFDRFVFLVKGRIAYDGPPSRLATFFASLGFEAPAHGACLVCEGGLTNRVITRATPPAHKTPSHPMRTPVSYTHLRAHET